ncbi:unnamed protein product [Polarella glacialis]|uniref:Calcineurin-like phosphoesterase domain-containing protein n=1 Tax=Polarella glacialis TaxID=89957 RepID=A0A813GZQ9_POLGL|nr:unnamed protein product [Polarella glacialis]
MAYCGIAWPEMVFYGKGEMHIFAIGDWGARIIQYNGGHTAGPHPFARARWNRWHTERLCTRAEFVDCHSGWRCNASCGFVEGVDNQPQLLVAEALKHRASQVDPQYILNVGDNFYWGGIEKNCGTPMGEISATARHQFDQVFEGIYSGPGLDGKPWLSVLGNHDWGGRVFNNGWDQQIAYTWASDRWVMPAPYFSQHVVYPDQGFSVDLFMIDSNAMDVQAMNKDPEHNPCGAAHNPPGANCSAAGGPASLETCHDWFWNLWREQQLWLEKKLAASTASWQIVVTHFPCGHEAQWYSKLHRSFGLDLLVTGHRHDQELKANAPELGGMTCFVTGGGGGITSEGIPGADQSEWYGGGQYGFYDLTISRSKIHIQSINYDGRVTGETIVRPHPF